MSLRLSIENASAVGPGIWRANLAPSSTRLISTAAPSKGSITVILVSKSASFDSATATLSFRADDASVLNVGATESTIVLQDDEVAPRAPQVQRGNPPPKLADGDEKFREVLGRASDKLQTLGLGLLQRVRTHFRGELESNGSWLFVERPNNFWAVRVQPRVNELLVTVRGRPSQFSSSTLITLKDDRPGYSQFKLTDLKQVDEAVRIIREAAPRK